MRHRVRKTHSRYDTRTSLAEFKNASVCRTDARKARRRPLDRALLNVRDWEKGKSTNGAVS